MLAGNIRVSGDIRIDSIHDGVGALMISAFGEFWKGGL